MSKSLYLITRKDETHSAWDEYIAFVICHKTPEQSLMLAQETAKDQGNFCTDNVNIMKIGNALQSCPVGVILSDFKEA